MPPAAHADSYHGGDQVGDRNDLEYGHILHRATEIEQNGRHADKEKGGQMPRKTNDALHGATAAAQLWQIFDGKDRLQDPHLTQPRMGDGQEKREQGGDGELQVHLFWRLMLPFSDSSGRLAGSAWYKRPFLPKAIDINLLLVFEKSLSTAK